MLAGVALSGAEWKDISYYEKDAPAQGNMEYRNERCKLDLRTPINSQSSRLWSIFTAAA